MKTYLLLTLLLFTSACSMNKLNSTIDNEKNDTLSKETLIRYSKDRIVTFYKSEDAKLSALAKCHNNNIRKGLVELKKLYKFCIKNRT